MGTATPSPGGRRAQGRDGRWGSVQVRTPLPRGQDGACPVPRQTQPRAGRQVWLVPAALTQPCGRLPPPSPLQEGPSWDLAPASSPIRQKHSRLPAGSQQGRDAVVLGLGRETHWPGTRQSLTAKPVAQRTLAGAVGTTHGGPWDHGTSPRMPTSPWQAATSHARPRPQGSAHDLTQQRLWHWCHGGGFPPGPHWRWVLDV